MSKSQSGSILFYILIAVALFAALSYAVSSMMRGGAEIGEQKDSILIDGTLEYARNVKQAIQTLRISNSCSDDEISFERSPFDGSDADYTNASAPTDFSCHVFHPQGGGLGYSTPDEDLSDYNYVFTGVFGVTDFGSNSSGELSFILRGVSLDQCTKINTKLGLGAPQSDDTANTNFFTVTFAGSFALDGGIGSGMGSGDAMYDGHAAGCFYEDNATTGEYFFYQVLLPR